MVFVDPTSLTISPAKPTDSTELTFNFIGVEDWGNILNPMFTAVFYIMYRPTKSSLDKTGWLELGRKVGFFDTEEDLDYTREPQVVSSTKKLPAGKYDFMAIEQGDWNGAGRDDASRFGYLQSVEIARDCSDPTIWCTPGCIGLPTITCGDCPEKSGCGSVCDSAPCDPSCSRSMTNPSCRPTECDTMCQFNNAFGTVVEPVKQYVPYIVAGVVGIVVLTLLFKKRKEVSKSASSVLSALLKDKDEL